MADDLISTALERAPDTDDVLIGPGALGSVGEVVRRVVGDRPVTVVADEVTWRVAGKQVQEQLDASGATAGEAFLFPAGTFVRADYANVEKVRDALASHEAIPVAVGSGTINDLTKLAAHRLGRPYMAVATAASMDGYTAFGASITRGGSSRRSTARPPSPSSPTLDVIAAAPTAMTASGYADLLAKVDRRGRLDRRRRARRRADRRGRPGTPCRAGCATWLGDPAGLRRGDRDAVRPPDRRPDDGRLRDAGGRGRAGRRPGPSTSSATCGTCSTTPTTAARRRTGSRSASARCASVALYEQLLDRDLGDIDVDALAAAWPTADQVARDVEAVHSIDGVRTAAVAESLAKHVGPEQLAERLELVRTRWPELRERLVGQLLPAAELAEMLRAAGAPSRPADIGVSAETLRDTYYRCRTIRRRYTVLDLAAETGVLEPCVEELFAPGGFWA